MHRDMCVMVDRSDSIVGARSKLDAHRFDRTANGSGDGLLHRAFSVFLFDSSDRLLLQRRADCKITFPRCWTNTCCSHPVTGIQPSEVDEAADVKVGEVPGIKWAARRKLEHELGIPLDTFHHKDLKFLTRILYCAPSEDGVWGEHELDYCLIGRAPSSMHLDPNPEEIGEVMWATPQQVATMTSDPTLKFSPWFSKIHSRFLLSWWSDLHATLSTSTHEDFSTIHEL